MVPGWGGRTDGASGEQHQTGHDAPRTVGSAAFTHKAIWVLAQTTSTHERYSQSVMQPTPCEVLRLALVLQMRVEENGIETEPGHKGRADEAHWTRFSASKMRASEQSIHSAGACIASHRIQCATDLRPGPSDPNNQRFLHEIRARQ